MNFKVRCLMSFSSTTKGKIYEIQDGYFCFDDGNKAGPYKNFKELNQHLGARFELVTDKPRICEILGVEVGEKFDIKGTGAGFHINEDGIMKWGGDTAQTWHLCESINHPEKIIRQPQFSEDEKALMRLYVGAGYPTFERELNGTIRAFQSKPAPTEIPRCDILIDGFLPQITKENSPFNAAEYLEGLK